ncbi:MAG: FUSC family protein, partial [Candidatus Microbacterium stercoravium]
FIARNYFIAQVFVTPLALLMSQFGGPLPSGELILERSVDTVLGVVAGLLAAFVIRNGHLRRHAKAAVVRLEHASRVPDEPDADEVQRTRSEIIAALAAVAAAVRTADNEWWTHRVDETRVIAAQKKAHEALARLG